MAARIIGTWEVYLVSLALLAMPLVSWLLVLAAGRGLRATRTLTPDRPVAGDELVISLRVTTDSLLPGCQLTLPDATGGLTAHRQVMEIESLGPRAERVVSTAPQPARRGVFHLPTLWAEAQDPLGLIRSRRHLGDPLEITVHPRLVHLHSCALSADSGTRRDWGRRRLAMLGAEEFRGIRPHYPGEPLSHVDWKATAKTGSLMLREMDDPMSSDLTLLLDGAASQVSKEARESSFELAVQAAGSVAAFTLGAGRSVDLMTHESRWRQTRLAPGLKGHLRLLDSLAGATPNATSPLPSSPLKLRSRGGRPMRAQALALVTLSLDQELVDSLISLRREGLQVAVIHVVAASFESGSASGAPEAESALPGPAHDTVAGLLVALASAGVLSLTLNRGDDLRSALSASQTKSRNTLPR